MIEELAKQLDGYLNRKFSGVQMAKLTGDLLETNNTFIGVSIFGREMFAKVSFPFGHEFVITKEWLDKYKDEVFAWVIYEHGDISFPIIIGFSFFDEKAPYTVFTQKRIRTEKFTVIYDDKNDEFTFTDSNDTEIKITADKLFYFLNGNLGVEIDNKIKIGGKDKATHPIAKGDEVVSILTDLINAIEKITVVTPVGNSSTPVNIPEFETIKAKLQTIKSTIVNVE